LHGVFGSRLGGRDVIGEVGVGRELLELRRLGAGPSVVFLIERCEVGFVLEMRLFVVFLYFVRKVWNDEARGRESAQLVTDLVVLEAGELVRRLIGKIFC
jgi:hypothetical protein